ncbi:tRNA pseudouridine55 synthase [Melghirimyces profundicolus]|uniref:tRNA pseudouridine synthase B n=1 Tax=Melghirimyces profundicolus TaxID=1242148 RepID=A0A2T6BRM0_9BACL|nr:tRNA pseudouridine(55) synthase TruB [Melghirimyces profundicolus]PTX58627.1 tRNA pseudouridine55 synthase [Melghirimyces profundicolus]
MLHGVIPVRKARGMTSHDVVSRIRRLAGQKKVGHTGTLDPEVEGVLPVCLGQATRIAEYIQELPKRYRGTMTLGSATDTQDQTGRVVEEREVGSLDPEEIDEVFRRFTGEIEQIPPMFSAVKVGGRKLYEWAREGREVPRKPRKVTIHSLRRIGMEKGKQPRIHFDVQCSKGTYVRTLCVDLGRALGYPAHMSGLIRTESGPFSLEDARSLEELESMAENGELDRALTGIGEALGHLPAVMVPRETFPDVMNGRPLGMEEQKEEQGPVPVGTLFRVYTDDGRFCALYTLKDKSKAIPVKVFRVR